MSKIEPIAEATLYGLPPVSEGARERREGNDGGEPAAEPPALARPSDAFVRGVAIVSLVAAVLGVLVLPGLLGSVAEAQAVWGERITAMAGYLSFAGLLLLTSTFGYELILRTELGLARYTLLALSVVVVGLAAPSISTRLIAIPQAILAIIAAVFALVAAVTSLRAPHTRAPAFVLGMVGLSGLFRAFGWSLASFASEGFSLGVARTFATLAVVAMGFAQLVAVAYFATRGRVQGRVVANLALVLGFFVTYLAARKPAFAGPIGAILAASIARGAPSPEPFFLGPVAHYLLPTGIFLALVAIVQRNQVTTVAVGLALALGSQGRLDVPLPALFCLVSGLLLVRASRDGRAMWSDLITTRAQKRADEGEGTSAPVVPKNVVVSEPKAPEKAEKAVPSEPNVAVGELASDQKESDQKLASEPKVAVAASEPKVAVAASEPKVAVAASEPKVAVAASEPKVAVSPASELPAGEPPVDAKVASEAEAPTVEAERERERG